MKQILMLIISLCLIFSACDKSKEEPSIEGKTCQIASVAGELLTYDEQGRISKLGFQNAPPHTTISYNLGSLSIISNGGNPNMKLTLQDGRVVKVDDYQQPSVYTFKYDSEGYLSEAVQLRGGETHTVVYVFTNGNLTKTQRSLLSNGKLTINPETVIEYSSESAANIADIGVPIESPFSFNLYKVSKYFGKQSKNLVSKMTTSAGVVLTYTYTKDVNGNITSVKRSGLDPYLIKYSCK